MSGEFNEVADATLRLTRAFRRHQMNAPVAILLKDKKDAYRIMHSASKTIDFQIADAASSTNVVEFNGTACGMMEICGVKYYWPLTRIAKPEGGFIYG